MTDQQTDPFRVSAIFDDGGIYTATMTNRKDAKHRYDMFTSNSQRPPSYVGLFHRKENGTFKVVRQFHGGNETVLEEDGA